MAINKVIVNGETKVDLTSDTATADEVLIGRTFHDATGELKRGGFVGGKIPIPFYFVHQYGADIYDPDGCLNEGLPCYFNINITTSAKYFFIYNLFHESDQIVEFQNTNEEISYYNTPNISNSGEFCVFATEPIENLLITLEKDASTY